jgi:hypothetical protein
MFPALFEISEEPAENPVEMPVESREKRRNSAAGGRIALTPVRIGKSFAIRDLIGYAAAGAPRASRRRGGGFFFHTDKRLRPLHLTAC